MSGSWRQQLRHARRVPFPKLAIVAVIIAGAALTSACSQPSDTQQAQQQQQAAAGEAEGADLTTFGAGCRGREAGRRIVGLNEAARKGADEKAWAAAEKA